MLDELVKILTDERYGDEIFKIASRDLDRIFELDNMLEIPAMGYTVFHVDPKFNYKKSWIYHVASSN